MKAMVSVLVLALVVGVLVERIDVGGLTQADLVGGFRAPNNNDRGKQVEVTSGGWNGAMETLVYVFPATYKNRFATTITPGSGWLTCWQKARIKK